MRGPLRLPWRRWTAASSPRWTLCKTVCLATPSAAAAWFRGSQPSGACPVTLARSSLVRRMRQGAPGSACSPGMNPSAIHQEWALEQWEGEDPPGLAVPWARKPRFSVDGSRSCAELAIVHHLRAGGWDGVWVNAFRGERRMSLWSIMVINLQAHGSGGGWRVALPLTRASRCPLARRTTGPSADGTHQTAAYALVNHSAKRRQHTQRIGRDRLTDVGRSASRCVVSPRMERRALRRSARILARCRPESW